MFAPDPATLAVFAAVSLTLYVSPGPDMIYIASRSIAQGRRGGLISVLGVSTGLLTHMLGAALGLSALLVVWPIAYAVIKWAGVAYLLYLGVRVLTAGDGGGLGAARARPKAGAWRIYREGLAVNLLNPKIALFFLAFLPQFVDPALGGFTVQMLFFGALFNAGGFVWIVSLALVFGSLGEWLSARPAVWRWQRRLTGSALVGLAAHLAFSERS